MSTSISTLDADAEYHICWVSLMLSITYAEYWLCWVSLMLSIAYAEYRLCWVSLMLSIAYAEYHLCWVSLMLSITYAEYRLCWVLHMLWKAYTEYYLCWVLHMLSILAIFYPSEWVRVVGFEPLILRSIPGRGFDAFTSTLLQYFLVRSKLIKYGTNREILLKGKAQYDWPSCTN